MRVLVEALCARACAGRAPGTPEGRAARALVVDALGAAGVEPFAPGGGWEQPIAASGGANVIGRVRGAGGGRALVVGAHYDHLGRVGGDTYWGADDNAAAVAILVEIAGALARSPGGLDRDVIVCAFDGEEPPWFLTDGMGSVELTRRPPLPLDAIDLMVCLDLVGHALGAADWPAAVRNSLLVFGAEKSAGTAALVDEVGPVDDLVVRRAGINLLPPLSDYHPFRERGVPFLFLTCGRWRHYHTPRDTPDRLDYRKMAATARWLERLVRVAAAPGPPRRFTDGNDDLASLAMMRELVTAMRDRWPDADAQLAQIAALAGRVRDDRLPPDAFLEALVLLARLEAAVA
jgi:hypothetical protein